MKAFLKSLTLENFKGVKKQTYNFSDNTKIFGRNASGKTTIYDGFLWSMFGVDSNWNSKFEVRPLDENGNKIHNVEISVTATLEIDGKEKVFRRVSKENWVLKRGSQDRTLQGNVGEYSIDDYPKTETEYKKAVSELVSEDIFKMITSPAYFPNLAWKDQRAIIMRFVENISDVDLARQNGEFSELIDELEKAPSTDDIQKKYQKALTEWKKKQTEIPVRIDELSAQKTDIDVAELELHRNVLKEQIAENKAKQEGASKQYEEYQKLADEVAKLKMQLSDMQRSANEDIRNKANDLRKQIAEKEGFISVLSEQMKRNNFEIQGYENDIVSGEKERNRLAELWKKVKAEVFDENTAICPTCHRELSEEERKRLITEFEQSKAERLQEIEVKGKGVKQDIDNAKQMIPRVKTCNEDNKNNAEKYSLEISELKKQLSEIDNNVDISDTAEYKSLSQQIADKERAMQDFKEDTARQQLKAELQTLNEQLTDIERQIAKAEQNVKIDDRIAELQTEQREVTQKVADQEKMLYLLEQFIRYKMDRVSDSINEKFDGVSFRLFEVQINGGIKETCECTVDGVPYQSLNSGHKIVAGLKIIKALQSLYEVYAPIFIDNAESVNEGNVPDMDCQVIFLSVDDGDLRVE